MSDNEKQTVLHMQRALMDFTSNEGVFYREKRGLLSFELGGKEQEKTGAEKTNLLLYAAKKFLAAAGEKPMPGTAEPFVNKDSNNALQEANQALLKWYSEIVGRHGMISIPGISAHFLSLYASLFMGVAVMMGDAHPEKENEEITEDAQKFMNRISSLCDAWQALNMEVTGDHALAFAKVQHKAGAARGTQALKDKKDRRNAIVMAQVGKLRAGGADVEKLRPSGVARLIREKTLGDFITAGFEADIDDAAFEKIVRRAMKIGQS